MSNLLKVGLTGGIGSGKSSAVHHFQSLGIEVLDADQIARQVVQPESVALEQIKQVFGPAALDTTGGLNRSWMREQIFIDPGARDRLEAITHPLIRQRITQDMMADYDVDYLVVDIPLLIEKDYQNLFDAVVVVDCTPEQQLARVQLRDGSDDTVIRGIMAAQVSRAERIQNATHILDNSGTLEYLYQQIDKLHQEFLKLSGSSAV